MTLNQYLEAIALSVLGLKNADAPEFKQKMLLVNDFKNIVRQRVVEYSTWYAGDSDALYNLYKVDNMTEFPTEPFYWKNRRSYFWSASQMDNEYKRTHSGFARDMVDTSVLVCGDPLLEIGQNGPQDIGGIPAKQAMDAVLEANDFYDVRRTEQMPMTMVQGWGAWKITWNVEVYGKEPVLHYYKAENVRVWRRSGRLLGVTFLDWYEDGSKRYLVAETRTSSPVRGCRTRTDFFAADGEANIMPIDAKDCPFSGGGDWVDMPCLFAEPCSYYKDTLHGYEGRSVLEGRLDLLDDLDQAFSQASNTDRRSAPIETFDVDFAEVDDKGQKKLPKTFERKYIQVHGKVNAYGEKDVSKPIEVTQPQLTTQIFDEHILSLERTIVNGHLSPATLGLDVEKKDRSKDDSKRDISVTLFTRNHLCKVDSGTIRSLVRQLMVAKEFLATGKVSHRPEDWDIKVSFDEFSDQSFESKIETLSSVLVNSGISPEMYVKKVYGNSLSEDEAKKEAEWISEQHKKQPEQDLGDNPFGEMGGDMPVLPEENEGAE